MALIKLRDLAAQPVLDLNTHPLYLWMSTRWALSTNPLIGGPISWSRNTAQDIIGAALEDIFLSPLYDAIS